MTNKFEAFYIKSITHIENYDADMLANTDLNNDRTHDIFSIELIFKPSIPDKNKRIFGYEQEIMDFMQSEVTIEGLLIKDEQNGALLQVLVLEGMLELRDLFPMNIVRVKSHFDLQDTSIKTTNRQSWKYEVVKEDT